MKELQKLTEDLKNSMMQKEVEFNSLISKIEDKEIKQKLIDSMILAKKNKLSISEFQKIASTLK